MREERCKMRATDRNQDPGRRSGKDEQVELKTKKARGRESELKTKVLRFGHIPVDCLLRLNGPGWPERSSFIRLPHRTYIICTAHLSGG